MTNEKPEQLPAPTGSPTPSVTPAPTSAEALPSHAVEHIERGASGTPENRKSD